MAKFETINTLMYQYLIENLEEDIELAIQRVEILKAEQDFENALFEQERVLVWGEQLQHLKKYLTREQSSHSNRPGHIEVSYFSNFGNKVNIDELIAMQLDSNEYYHRPTGVKLNDWRNLEEGKLYVIGNNLSLRIDNGTLMSKYPFEKMWYDLDENHESDGKVFQCFGEHEVYLQNTEHALT